MNNTQIIGAGIFIIGMATHVKFRSHPSGTFLFIVGGFLLWNGWVASVNDDRNFAIFG
tara:strand:- start:1440 stop:1613 length:174 start_codon:yes stop_codon:yes gene_type:complete